MSQVIVVTGFRIVVIAICALNFAFNEGDGDDSGVRVCWEAGKISCVIVVIVLM